MSKKNQSMMPQSTAGLIRYFDESEAKVKFKPEHVVAFSVVIIVLELVLKFMF
ncbi:MAG: preprotein translocase subunit Sec61beta [Candidatus Aenigmarchaeota archaeon]|nr:preprotein translocase subunit Sec61beta [Candidatus Aenigmarchaeota archaeon]